MRILLLKVVAVLLVAGSGEARPQKTDEVARPESPEKAKDVPDVRVDSSVPATDNQRHLKDLQYIDQSLRTVATQLLNVSNPDDNKSPNVNKPILLQNRPEKNDVSLMKEVNAEISHLESTGVSFGRPINSKFGYFESSHPGQAMAITEEELEKELSSTRLITTQKNHPTTTGGISTWILLNPPSTTVKTAEEKDATKKIKQTTEAEVRTTTNPTTTMERIETTVKEIEKSTVPISSSTLAEKVTTSTKKPSVITTRRTTVSQKTEKVPTTEKVIVASSTPLKVPLTTTTAKSVESTEAISSTTRKPQVTRTTPKPKVTVSKTTVVAKPTTTKTSRPNSANRPSKPITRRTTVKPEIIKHENVSTAKIEKVTFKPVQVITTPKNKGETTEKPMFVTKIKASVLMDTQKTSTTLVSSTTASTIITSRSTTVRPSLASTDLIEVPVRSKPVGTKVNNVLKVQLKKPIDETTKIEIEPIKVNAPVLRIEKVGNDNEKLNKETSDKETDLLNNSKIDLKFDFNPELTKVSVDTSVEDSSSTRSTTVSTTTKRPRHSSKRKKNKVRRRKPTTASTSSTTVSTTAALDLLENEITTETGLMDAGIQESKVAPETKLTTNTTKNKKKQVAKPISTQIYNYLSREVMPSFGMVSLLGLGLGLASYFLYPFGGTIARRNYEVEPKYKYNLDEYGGSYGQSEEEVLSKVLQGMTTEEKYSKKDFDNNYYRYQQYDGAYDPQTTRRPEHYPVSSSPIYRPDNAAPSFKYRNTDYRYHAPATTPHYYDRSKRPEFVTGQEHTGPANRQFVVGNIPKDYSAYDDKTAALPTTGKVSPSSNYDSIENSQVQFDQNVAPNYNFPVNPGTVQDYGQETQTLRNEEGYDEFEITPTAVAVEHGPRSLRKKRSLSNILSRVKRDSVIQIIPSKRELEEEEKEENLSNEILDIIDLALPGGEHEKSKKQHEENEIENPDVHQKKKEDEERKRLKESTLRSSTVDTTESVKIDASTEESTSMANDASVNNVDSASFTVSTSEKSVDVDSSSSSTKATDESTVEWIEFTTKKPEENHFNLFSFVKKVAEIKFRLGLTLLKHASEGFARYLGHVQKRLNGDE